MLLRSDVNSLASAGIVISASSANADYPVANISSNEPTEVWRSETCARVGILIDHLTAVSADAIALVNTNLSASAVIVLTRGSTPSCLNQSVTLTGGKPNIWKLFNIGSYRYSRLEFYDPTNIYGFIKLGVLWLGVRTRFDYGFAHGWTSTPDQIVGETISEFGRPFVEYLGEQTRINLNFEALDSDEIAALRVVWRALQGGVKPLFLIPDARRDDGWWMRMLKFDRRRGKKDSLALLFEELTRGATLQ